jgi:hypothetical protein
MFILTELRIGMVIPMMTSVPSRRWFQIMGAVDQR